MYVLGTLSRLRSVKHMSIKVAAYCRVSTDSKSTLRRIIDNEKYCGLNNSLKYDTGEVFNKNSYPKVKDEYTVQPTDKIPVSEYRRLLGDFLCFVFLF